MPKDDLVYVGHMLERAEKASALVSDKDRAAYDEDEVSKPSRPNYEPSEV